MASVTACIHFDDGMTVEACVEGNETYPQCLRQMGAEALTTCIALVHETREAAG